MLDDKKTNYHRLFFIYPLIYAPWYLYLEKRTLNTYHIVHCFLDDVIPFCEYFVIPYFFWFIYMGALLAFLYIKNKDEFCRYCLWLTSGMTICLFIYQFFPNGTGPSLRPAIDVSKNWAMRVVAWLYRTDTSTNVFPSIHVFNTIGTHVAICRSAYFHDKPIIKGASLFAVIAITLSTVCLKQHSALDAVAAMALSYIVFLFSYAKVPIPEISLELFEKKNKKKMA